MDEPGCIAVQHSAFWANATNQAFGNMQNMAKQMTEIADANLQAASSVTAKAVGASKKK